MSTNKKLFSTLTALTVGAVAGTAIALSPVVAHAEHDGHADHGCKGEKGCKGDKKDAEKTPTADGHGEHSCKGEKGCKGDKH